MKYQKTNIQTEKIEKLENIINIRQKENVFKK